MKKPAVTFNIGDRVALAKSPTYGAVYPRTHGVVVYYRAKHNPKKPRVRWADGWGLCLKAKDLRHANEEELNLPVPKTFNCDQP